MKLAARILTAMAIVSLAMMYIATRDQLPNASAATGTINALNVGTCYATDKAAFKKSDCDDGGAAAFDVAGRKDLADAETLYATYAFDPRTTGGSPRAVLLNSDLLRISIKDAGRDKRVGVLYSVGGGALAATLNMNIDDPAYKSVIANEIDLDDLQEGLVSDTGVLSMSSTAAQFTIQDDADVVPNTPSNHIRRSGETKFTLTGTSETTDNPIAPINDDKGYGLKLGKLRFFGFLQDDTDGTLNNPATLGALNALADAPDTDLTTLGDNLRDLTGILVPDEDFGCQTNPNAADPDGDCDNTAPWFYVDANLVTGQAITVVYVYYETSEREEIVGGRTKKQYDDNKIITRAANAAAEPPITEESDPFVAEDPGFSSDESADSNPKALQVSVSADGAKTTRNLWLKETGRFTGNYVGYVRLTDSSGNGSEAGESDQLATRNWGRKVRDGMGDTVVSAAVIGVNDGPVTIKYRDTDDDNQSLAIKIDTSPPLITIEGPVHELSTRDASPNFQGFFEDDGGSGLREDSFKLYADNKDDVEEDGEKGRPVLDLEVYGKDGRAAGVRGIVTIPADKNADGISIPGDYRGYVTTQGARGDDTTFGIVRASEVYLPASTYRSTEDEDLEILERQVLNAEDFDDGAANGEFDDSVRFDFSSELPNETFNNVIDFQAVVLDIAGNLGFSDSETSSPRLIHEYGVKSKDRERDRHNVLGWYSRHILFLDLVDPAVQPNESATGFYGEDDDDVRERSDNGVMVVFDKPVSSEEINVSTFDVTLEGGDEATVKEVDVQGRRVYLLLEETLAPNAKPKVDLAAGQLIRDRAGNSTTPREFDEFAVSDGILPTFTVVLRGGSGLISPDWGPENFTKEQIEVVITSNEDIQGAPRVTVLCQGFQWANRGADPPPTAAQIADQLEENDVAKYVSNRNGALTSTEFGNAGPKDTDIDDDYDNCYRRGVDYDPDEMNPNPDSISTVTALRRSKNRWTYTWDKDTDGLRDGPLTVVVTGRDRGGFRDGSKSLLNYSSATAKFTLDSVLLSPTKANGGEVIPGPDEAVSEPRPFVMIDFNEKPPVTPTKFEVDGVDLLIYLRTLDNNRFVYWPEGLAIGTYTVKVEANDAANNTVEFQYKFTVRERLPFTLNLLAGWNTISFPANPQDRALHAVFTEPDIDQVIGWDATNPTSPWRAATRVDGVWTTGEDYAVLNDVEARYGYWVHSRGFVNQTVKLVGKGDRIGPLFNTTVDIPTQPRGWNFVGVVDVDGDQTEDNAGQTLLNSKKAPISASQYLGDYRNAYTWNNIDNKWQRMRPDGPITIGTGIWVYYDKGGDIAP